MLEDLIRNATQAERATLVPEIALRLARDPIGIFTAADAWPREGERFPPYWAFAWPGGQATARFLLDHPDEVAGRRVLDIGTGSGIAAIAAAKAGAAKVLAADIDPFAVVATAMNAAANGVTVETTAADVLGTLPEADLVLAGDLVYEPEQATRVAAMLEAAAQQRIEVLVADRTCARRLHVGNRGRAGGFAFELVAEYDAPLTPALAAHPFERARLWRLTARRSGRTPRP